MTGDSTLTSPFVGVDRKATEQAKVAVARATSEPRALQWFLIALTIGLLGLILVLPLAIVFFEAFRRGLGVYRASLTDPDALAAIVLTLKVAAISVPINTLFGIAAAWAITKFRFKGKSWLITLLDLPFAVSPVVSGLIFVLLFGRSGISPIIVAKLNSWIIGLNNGIESLNQSLPLIQLPYLKYIAELKIIFAVPGIVLATLFVTFPFVARQLIAFMEAQGSEEEEAAVTLGANGFQTFWRVTLPNIKWALLTGIILCNARAMGEFGAVSVVSGHVRGMTNTVPLQVEILYNEYQFAASFAVASLLTLLGLVTLGLKQFLEWKTARQLSEGQQ